MDYVVGFAFTSGPLPNTRVLLIRKNKPEWQAGKLNGIGGKIGDKPEYRHERPVDAMVREFAEETGVLSGAEDWHLYAVMHDGQHEHNVYCFESRVDRLYDKAETMEEEEVVRCRVDNILKPSIPLIPNLRSKLMLALDRESWRRPTFLVYGGQHFRRRILRRNQGETPLTRVAGPSR
jgi:8-oxo-dGTP diphosphatase